METFAYDHGLPCKNPNCKSHGQPHPNCRCYAGSSAGMAEGGKVEAFCSQTRSHNPTCKYFATGGPVPYALYADGGSVGPFEQAAVADPRGTVESYTAQHGLLKLLTQAGVPKSDHPTKHLTDYLDGAKRGQQRLKSHAEGKTEPANNDSAQALSDHLDELSEDPSPLLDAGGQLGQYLPDHALHVGETAGRAIDYFKSLKPQGTQTSPLDDVTPPGKSQQADYMRRLAIAEHPLSILHRADDGTLRPTDVATVSNLYPRLFQAVQAKATERLVKDKSSGKELTKRQRLGFSVLLGQALDSTQTPQAMQAIMASAASQQAQRMPKQARATSAELKTIEKVDSLYETPLEARLTHKKA